MSIIHILYVLLFFIFIVYYLYTTHCVNNLKVKANHLYLYNQILIVFKKTKNRTLK